MHGHILMSRGQLAAGDRLRLLSVRQASEQYFTSSQFLAQDFRQVIVRPHMLQSLLGRKLLLPGWSRLVMASASPAVWRLWGPGCARAAK